MPKVARPSQIQGQYRNSPLNAPLQIQHLSSSYTTQNDTRTYRQQIGLQIDQLGDQNSPLPLSPAQSHITKYESSPTPVGNQLQDCQQQEGQDHLIMPQLQTHQAYYGATPSQSYQSHSRSQSHSHLQSSPGLYAPPQYTQSGAVPPQFPHPYQQIQPSPRPQTTQRSQPHQRSKSQSYNPTPQPLRSSSGAWSPEDDEKLLEARARDLGWGPIKDTYFPSKSANACRKRHERLMERRSTSDWDTLKLEQLARQYMALRKEIWSQLAMSCGEKWTTVEAKCMGSGLKNLQAAARSDERRERNTSGFAGDDSGIGIDDDDGLDNDAAGMVMAANTLRYEYANINGNRHEDLGWSGQNRRIQHQSRSPGGMGIENIMNGGNPVRRS